MKSRLTLVILLAVAGLAVTPRPAAADGTAFLGLTTSPTTRPAYGFGLGFGFTIIGFEFEYSAGNEDRAAGAPSLKMGSVNGLLQTPVAIAGMQFYATLGGEVYHEVLDTSHVTNVGMNVGGGVKLQLVGPIRVRFDYRLYRLGGSPLYSRPQRFYVGFNLKF